MMSLKIPAWIFCLHLIEKAAVSVDAAFVPVNGGVDRACRGSNADDNSDAYYVLHEHVETLEDCQKFCRNHTPGNSSNLCVGIEFSAFHMRCEVWTRAEGIGTSISASGFMCQRFDEDSEEKWPILEVGQINVSGMMDWQHFTFNAGAFQQPPVVLTMPTQKGDEKQDYPYGSMPAEGKWELFGNGDCRDAEGGVPVHFVQQSPDSGSHTVDDCSHICRAWADSWPVERCCHAFALRTLANGTSRCVLYALNDHNAEQCLALRGFTKIGGQGYGEVHKVDANRAEYDCYKFRLLQNQPVAIRIRSVTVYGFEAVLVEPEGSDGPHHEMEVTYIAAAPGVHKLQGAPGSAQEAYVFEAGRINTTRILGGCGNTEDQELNWENLTLLGHYNISNSDPPDLRNQFSRPALLTTIQTANNEARDIPNTWSSPWMTAAGRVGNTARRRRYRGFEFFVDGEGNYHPQVALEASETRLQNLTKPEEIGYMMIQSSTSSVNTRSPSQSSILNDASEVVKFSATYARSVCHYEYGTFPCRTLTAGPYLVASTNSRLDAKGGWLARRATYHDGETFSVLQDKTCNPDTRHQQAEMLSIVAFDKEFVVRSEAGWANPQPGSAGAVPDDSFMSVDGGSDRACRGENPGDVDPSYFNRVAGPNGNASLSLEGCKRVCYADKSCVAFQQSALTGVCDLWTKAEGVQNSVAAAGQMCMHKVVKVFQPLDGGHDRACRGSHPDDNSDLYFLLKPDVFSLAECQDLCRQEVHCKGIEHSAATGRCEVWTRTDGIGATTNVAGFLCQVYDLPVIRTTTVTTTTTVTATSTTITTTSLPGFTPVDGGADRACRGLDVYDTSDTYYLAFEISNCKKKCVETPGCKGVEISSNRCEVWIREDGIQASWPAPKYQCFRYNEDQQAEPLWTAIDGADRACRGWNVDDNDVKHYELHTWIETGWRSSALHECQAKCVAHPACRGIEFIKQGSDVRCEVWTRTEGIGATASVPGYSCIRYRNPNLIESKWC
eukprot:TRINITY_DN27212_c0_g1_i2.p1 TRINITY_DN27212_c0_g1~~TRINITY_DN27212_c0_g1_i2.p1  ORF type:complete len:1006 (+),score=138.70 TRINITY_DN27212_c0_g1_i2:112-3129(+)